MYRGEVMTDIFGNDVQPKEIELTLFADERKNINNRWDYLCLLIIPTNKIKEAFDIIESCRLVDKWPQKEKGKIMYEGELKFSEINKDAKGEKFEVAKKWLEEIINDGKEGRGIFYCSILGIDRHMLHFSNFGKGSSPKGKYANIYNRFFRTNFLASIKTFFSKYDIIIVESIFHDKEGNLEQHLYFDWHLIWKVEREEENIFFVSDKIIFVESDHQKEKNYSWASHFIQMADILVGSVTYCLDYTNPSNKGQKELAKLILPLVYRLVEMPTNKNSSFGYFNKYKLSFFPNSEGEVYTLRKIKLLELESKQQSLF